VLGKDIFLDKYRTDLEAEARWLAFGAEFKANSIETLLKRHGIRPDVLLELGSGTGAVIRECQRRGLAREYIAIDASEEAISWARERSPGIRSMVADITSPQCELPARVDVVILSHVLEHLENPKDLLVSLVERLPFRWLIAEVPLEDLAAARIKNVFRDRMKNTAGHVQFFTARSFQDLLASAGLTVSDSVRYFPLPGKEMLEHYLRSATRSFAGRTVKRATNSYLPRLFGPLWVKGYHAHMAVLCSIDCESNRDGVLL